MKQTLQILTLLLTSFNLFGQTTYTGFIDKYPIELATEVDVFSDGDGHARGVYAYSNHNTPIRVNGELKQGTLTLFEKDEQGNNKATLTFENFDENSQQLDGIWKDLTSNKQYKIRLTKNFGLDLIQSVSLKDKYFRLVVDGPSRFFSRVTGVKILEKKTNKLIQHIDLDCQFLGFDNISVGDYNFDGIEDFSVFEGSYVGPNTSSRYFLFDPKTNEYFDSNFDGTSLEFDSNAKKIYEHNQCCAGRYRMHAEYEVINNEMVLVEQTCLEYDETTDDYKTVECE